MSDVPGRPAFEPERRAGRDDPDDGWGSPLPAEYGSLRGVRRPSSDDGRDRPNRAEPDDRGDRGDRADQSGDGGDDRSMLAGAGRAVTSILRRLQDDPAGEEAAAPGPLPHLATKVVEAAVDTSDTTTDTRPDPSGPPDRRPGPMAGGAPDPVADTIAVPVVPPEPPVPADPGIDPAALTFPPLGPFGPDVTVAVGGHRRRRVPRRPGRVRTRATIRHLDLMTVLRVSVVFWLTMLIAVVVASVLLWAFADAFGSLPSIEKSVRTLFSLKSFKLHPSTVAGYTAGVGVIIAVAGVLANMVFAVIYNLIADVVGGIRVELESYQRD